MTLGARRVAGLDIGQTSTKLVVVEAARGGVKVVKTAIFRNREEGILDLAEVREHLATWLHEQGWADLDFNVGLPQYMAMTNIADFPLSGTAKLEEMVAFETQQLAGLTDEVFLDDYRRLRAFHHYQNPVLIGVARETLVEQRLDLLRRAEVRVDHLFLDGEVLASVFTQTRKTEAAAKGLALVLDVGAENTTLVIVLDGQVLYLSSFLFGGDFFSEALARHLGTSELEAEKTKRGTRLVPTDEQSPLTRTARNFVVELEAGLDTWRTHDPEATKLRIESIWLSGGGAQLAGFGEFLQQTYNCPVEPLVAPDMTAQQGEAAAAFNIAYGLARHGLDDVKRPAILSLMPAALRWQALRRKRLAALYLAMVLLVLLCAGYFALSLFALNQEWESLNRQGERLDKCKAVVPELTFARDAIERYQHMLQPFAARGNRNRKFVEAIDKLNAAKQSGDWVYLVADYPLSYRNTPDPLQRVGDAPSSAGAVGLLGPMPAGPLTGGDDQVTVLAQTAMPWTGLAVSGFTPRQKELQNVREMIRLLNDSKFFVKVDANPHLSAEDGQARAQWMMFGMKPFSLVCPFADVEFELPKGEDKAK